MPNDSVAGETAAIGEMPVPLSEIVCGPAGSGVLMVIVAARAPAAVGLNLTLIVQLDLGLRLVPQLLFRMKSPGFVPPTVMPVIDSAVAPWLVSVTLDTALVVLTSWGPNVSAPVLKLIAVLVPLRETD